MMKRRGFLLALVLILALLVAAGVAVRVGTGGDRAEESMKTVSLGDMPQGGQGEAEALQELMDRKREIVMKEAEHIMEAKENEAYFASISTLEAGQVVDTERLTGDQLGQLFYGEEIREGDAVYSRINGCSYRENPNIALSQLRYLRVLHCGFDGQTHVGEMIVNREIAGDVLEIFKQLYEAGYPIERMRLVDDYQGDDNASMGDNNSSAFNYRYIASTTRLSNHSWGKAIDINPFYNPYIYTDEGGLHVDPEGSWEYVDRGGDCPYMIDHEDLCYRLFAEHGFSWGGDWNTRKDYQHFEKE